MHILYMVIIVLAALAYGYAAMSNFVGADSVKVVAERVRVSSRWMIPLGILLASGAGGLLIGLAVPVLGIAAASSLVVYFVCALTAQIRVHDRGIGGAVSCSGSTAAGYDAALRSCFTEPKRLPHTPPRTRNSTRTWCRRS
jgi:hypothetical protein